MSATSSTVRRAVLIAVAAVLALTGCTTGGSTGIEPVPFDQPLRIPPVESGTVGSDGVREYDLVAQSGTSDYGRGMQAATIGFDGPSLGPTLRMPRGEDVRVRVRNDLAEPTTVHWHGMALPARMDGGPHQQIEPGERWAPQWRVDQPAASLWYHAHLHGNTAQQVYRGLAGMLLVDDPKGAPALPQQYGVDDIPLIVQDKTFTRDGELVVDVRGRSSTGFLGDTVVVNGGIAGYQPVTTETVRLRLLNASNARFYRFGISDDRTFDIIASDGGLLAQPVTTDRVQLSPGERAEIIVRFQPGETVELISDQPELGHSIGSSDRFGGGVFPVVQFRAAAELRTGVPTPAVLAPLTPAEAPADATVRSFGMTDHAINGAPMDMSRIDLAVPVDTKEVWAVTNQNPQPHNFHVHDGSFRVLSIDGAPPPPELAGLKDTVYVAPRSTVRLLVEFRGDADPKHPLMYHCHLLLHEDIGVMGQFVVVRPGQRPVVPTRAGADAPAAAHGHGSADPLRRGGDVAADATG